MNDFTAEDVINMIQLAQTIDDQEREQWLMRVVDDLHKNNQQLSKELMSELADLFEREMKYIEENTLPELDNGSHQVEEERRDQLEAIRPDLIDMIDEYEAETAKLLKEHEEAFRVIDGGFDAAMQEALAGHEEAEISALREKLATPSGESSKKSSN